MMNKLLRRLCRPFATWAVVWARLEQSSMQVWSDGVPITMYSVTEYSERRFWRWTLSECTSRYSTLLDAPKAGEVVCVRYQAEFGGGADYE